MTLTIGARERRPRLSLFIRTQSPVIASLLIFGLLVAAFDIEIPHLGWVAIGLAIVAVATIASLVIPWERLPQQPQAAVAVVDLVGIVVISIATYATIETASALAAFPAVWLAVVVGWWGVAVGIVGVYAASFLPLIITPGMPDAHEWASALVIPLALSVVVFVARLLTARYERAAADLVAAFEERNAATAESERVGTILRSFADGVDIGLLFLDDQGETVIFNNALLEFGRLARYDDAHGSSMRMYEADQVTPIAPEDQPLARLRRGETIDGFVHWVGRQGTQRALVANGGRVTREDGTLAGSMLIIQDATELLRSGRSREDALATLAHELRTPLTSIVGYTDLLLLDDLSPSATARVEVVARNADHLLTLTSVFLDGLHREADVHRERIGVRDVVEQTVDVLRTTPDFGARQLQIDIDDDLAVTADRDGVIAVLSNLLSNAVKFSSTCDLIHVSAGSDDMWVAIVVRNTGSHIDPQDLERIFDRFYRGGNAQREAVAGTGIGLAVSRDIVAAHGGTLTAEDAGDSVSFKICFPRD